MLAEAPAACASHGHTGTRKEVTRTREMLCRMQKASRSSRESPGSDHWLRSPSSSNAARCTSVNRSRFGARSSSPSDSCASLRMQSGVKSLRHYARCV